MGRYRAIWCVLMWMAPAAAADPAQRFCDPVTNVCYCSGDWQGRECSEMRALCEDGAWKACTDDVCSCTRAPWVYEPDDEAADEEDEPA